jgi:hypothetical protein
MEESGWSVPCAPLSPLVKCRGIATHDSTLSTADGEGHPRLPLPLNLREMSDMVDAVIRQSIGRISAAFAETVVHGRSNRNLPVSHDDVAIGSCPSPFTSFTRGPIAGHVATRHEQRTDEESPNLCSIDGISQQPRRRRTIKSR